jgi:hypothetical protein
MIFDTFLWSKFVGTGEICKRVKVVENRDNGMGQRKLNERAGRVNGAGKNVDHIGRSGRP